MGTSNLHNAALMIFNEPEAIFRQYFQTGGRTIILQITTEELQKMKQILLDEDRAEAPAQRTILHRRLMEKMNNGMNSHLGQSSVLIV